VTELPGIPHLNPIAIYSYVFSIYLFEPLTVVILG